MVFASLRKGHRSPAVFSPGAASYFDPKSPEQKRREKERLKHRDLGFGLLNSPGGAGNEEEDETSDAESQAHHMAYAPLNVQELEQSIHSRFSHQTKTSGSSSGERSREAPLSQSLQQELDDFGNLLNRHATLESSHDKSKKKAPSKWGSPVKDAKPQLFPTLQPSTRDLLAANSSHHQRGNIASPAKRSAPQNTAIGQNRAAQLKEKPAVPTASTSFFDENHKPPDFSSQHSRKPSIPRNSITPDFPSQHSRNLEDRRKNKVPPKQATITRRRMTRKNMLSQSEDEHSNDDSFFDDPTKWNSRPGSPRRRNRADSEDPSLTDGGESDACAAAPLYHSTHQRSPPHADPFHSGTADPAYSSPQRRSPQATTTGIAAPTPGTSMTTKNYVALEQGDWASLMDTNPMLIKSPEGKLRPTMHEPKLKKKDAAQQMATCRSLSGGSSSSEDDSVYSRNTRDTGLFSEDELELELYSSDEDDDEDAAVLNKLHTSIVSVDVPESPEVRRQVARLTSGQLRRWDGFQLQVVSLVKIALPDQVGQVSALMKRFAGREAELIQTLQTMCRRLEAAPSCAKKQSIHHSRGLISRTGVESPRRISAIAGRKIDAIARIAAANTLDDQTRAVKPEYVIDDGDQSFWQNSKCGSSLNGSSLLNSEDLEDSEDSSYSDEPYEYEEERNRRSAYSEYGEDDDEDGYESYEDDEEEEGSEYKDDNYEGDDYEQEEESYDPNGDDDSSSSGNLDARQWR